jgi:hypothetical protein
MTRIQLTPRLAVRTGAVLLAGAVGLTVATPVATAAPQPTPPSQSSSNGNSGTIKVAFPNADTAPGNDAKPGCTVRLDFYGFRQGTYQAAFHAIAPTGSKLLASGDVTVTQPRTPASRFQTSRRFTLDVSGLTPGNAGYHVGVKVTNPASGGGAKSKTFSFPCLPGNTVQFSGGSGSISVVGSSRGVVGSPRGGVASGAGGTAPTSLPIAPMGGLLAGLALLGAGVVTRKRSS